jgi:hypothetical protein
VLPRIFQKIAHTHISSMATTDRTPPGTQSKQNSPATFEINQNKRKAEKSNDDIYSLMLANNSEIKAALTGIHKQIKTMDSNVAKIESNLKETNARMERVEETANEGVRMATQNRKLLGNMIKQGKLENLMEISGIPSEDFAKHSGPKEVAISVFRSLQIQVDPDDIRRAIRKDITIKKPNGDNRKVPILIVTFSDFEKKAQVMAKKKNLGPSSKIYFNLALTPLNGFLTRRAKAITKGKNLHVHFGDEAVRVKKADGSDFIIHDEADLKALQTYVDSLPKPAKDTEMLLLS